MQCFTTALSLSARRGEEYILAMGPGAPQMAPPALPSDTDIYADSLDFGKRARAPFRSVPTNDDDALAFEGILPGYAGKYGIYNTPSTSTLRDMYDVDSRAVLRKYLEQELPIFSRKYETEPSSVLSDLYNVDSKAVLSKYLEQDLPIFKKTYDTEALSDLYNVDIKAVLRKYLEQELPIFKKTYGTEALSPMYNVGSKVVVEQDRPIITKRTEVVAQPIIKNMYTIQPRPVIRPIVNVLPAPVVRRPINVLPPPVVQKLYKVMPAPIIRKFFTAPPTAQRASAPVFNKYVKNIFVEKPEQQRPVVVVPPSPSKNVYNLIKVAAPTPKPLEVVTPLPTTTPMPTTTPVPTTTPPPVTTPAPEVAAAVVEDEALAEEEEEAAAEEQKLKSVGKMVVVETVRRIVDVPEFDGPAPPPARSEETVVDADGTVRKFEKYIEYDQVPVVKQQATATRTSHSKKQAAKSKSSYAALSSHAQQLHGPALVDAVKASASPASSTTARFMSAQPVYNSALFPAGTSNLQQGSSLFPRFGSSFDDTRRSLFGKALEPDNLEENPEGDTFAVPENYMELLDTPLKPVELLAAQKSEPSPAAPSTPTAEPAVAPMTTTSPLSKA